MKVPPGINVGSHVNDQHAPATLWLFHPLTGKQADDISSELGAMAPLQRLRARRDFLATKKAGGLFYWMCRDGEWGRVELANFAFVAMGCGQTLDVQHNFPPGTDRLEWMKKRVEGLKT